MILSSSIQRNLGLWIAGNSKGKVNESGILHLSIVHVVWNKGLSKYFPLESFHYLYVLEEIKHLLEAKGKFQVVGEEQTPA